jgi:GNAT superfamily N-acetyltransferase
MLKIQPFSFSESDYRRAMEINTAVFNQPTEPLEEWQHDDQAHDPAYPFFRDLVTRAGSVIAYFETFQSQFAYHPRKYACVIYVDPRHDSADVRPFVLEHTLDRLRAEDLIALASGMLDNIPQAMRFFDDFGFKRVAEEKLSKLDVTAFEAAGFGPLLARLEAAGIRMVPLCHLQGTDPDWQQKLFDLDVTVNRDIPSQGEKRFPNFEDWRRLRLDSPAFDPEAWFVALDGEKYVAQSQGSINRQSCPVQFNTGVTTTRREYRRRGIATALKVHIIRYLQTQGVEEIFTTNDSHNPMYQLNLALGFQPLPSWVRVEKPLQGAGSDRGAPLE